MLQRHARGAVVKQSAWQEPQCKPFEKSTPIAAYKVVYESCCLQPEKLNQHRPRDGGCSRKTKPAFPHIVLAQAGTHGADQKS